MGIFNNLLFCILHVASPYEFDGFRAPMSLQNQISKLLQVSPTQCEPGDLKPKTVPYVFWPAQMPIRLTQESLQLSISTAVPANVAAHRRRAVLWAVAGVFADLMLSCA